MKPTDKREVRADRARGHGDGLRHGADRQPVPGRAGGRRARGLQRRLGCRPPLFRYRADVRPRPRRAPSRRGAPLASRATNMCSRPRSAACSSRCRRQRSTSPFWVDMPPFEIVHDYSYDAVMRSFEDSLQRIGQSRFDILFIHDIDVWTHGPELPGAAFPARRWTAATRRSTSFAPRAGHCDRRRLQRMAGLRGGAPRARLRLLPARRALYAARAGRARHFPAALRGAQRRRSSLGGGYNSGILATRLAAPGAHYNYAPAPQTIIERVRKIEAVCKEYGVPMKAAALQFVLAHPAIPTNIPGTRTREHLDENLALIGLPIPGEFWAAMKKAGLIRENAPTPA